MVERELEDKLGTKIEESLKEYLTTEEKLWGIFKGKEIVELATLADKSTASYKEYERKDIALMKQLKIGQITKDEYYEQGNKFWDEHLKASDDYWVEFIKKRKVDFREYLQNEMTAWVTCNNKFLSIMKEFLKKGVSLEVKDREKERKQWYEFLDTERILNKERNKRRLAAFDTFITAKRAYTPVELAKYRLL